MDSLHIDLPNELQFEIFKFLDLKELFNASLCCKRFSKYASSVEIWKILVNSLFRPHQFIPELHSIIKYGSEIDLLQKTYKITKKATFIKNQQDLDQYQTKINDTIYIYPGNYSIKENLHEIPSTNIIGLGQNNSEVVISGGKDAWGVLNIENSNLSFEKSKIQNVTLKSIKEDINNHMICVSNVYLMISNCTFESENAQATCINIYGKTHCILENNKIKNSNKHGIYCGQGSKSLIRFNEIINTKHSGIHIISKGSSIIENNYIKDCLHHGIYVNDQGSAEIRNNQIINCEGFGIEKEETSYRVIDENNTLINCKGNFVEKTTSRDNNDCILM